jgi:hypothetical protein
MNQKLVVFDFLGRHSFYAMVNTYTDDTFIQEVASAAISDARAESRENWRVHQTHVCNDGLELIKSVQARLEVLGFKIVDQSTKVIDWGPQSSGKSLLEVRLAAAGIAYKRTGGTKRHLLIPTKTGEIITDSEMGTWGCCAQGTHGTLGGSGTKQLIQLVELRGQEGVPF